MPIYKFRCPECGEFTELLKIDETLEMCPNCGSEEIEKLFTTANVHYNGMGFYSSTPYGEKMKG